MSLYIFSKIFEFSLGSSDVSIICPRWSNTWYIGSGEYEWVPVNSSFWVHSALAPGNAGDWKSVDKYCQVNVIGID